MMVSNTADCCASRNRKYARRARDYMPLMDRMAPSQRVSSGSEPRAGVARHFWGRITRWVWRWLGQWLGRLKGRVPGRIMHRTIRRITLGRRHRIV
jgi:hypothetical protein